MRRFFSLAALFLAFPLLNLVAQPVPEEESRPDTVRTYRLGEVVVQADRFRLVHPTTIQQVPRERIERSDASSAAGIAVQIPAARIQTNSRGEALLYLRGAGERQVALFLDGALLNVPWDNRVDLSFIPLNVIGGVTVSKGAPSVLYGANVVGGAVNMVSKELRSPGFVTEISAQAGEHRFGSGTLTHMGNVSSFNYVAAGSYTTRDAQPLPAEASLPFNQIGEETRTNTDLELLSLYGRGEYRFTPNAALGLSTTYLKGEKGVAPEGHKKGARFWRYPSWRNVTTTLNGDARFGAGDAWHLHGAAWHTLFAQEIASYPDSQFVTPSARQEDDDVTVGSRLVLRHDFGNNALSLALNGLTSQHEQRDLQYDATGALKPLKDSTGAVIPYPTLLYQQQIYSVGLEYENSILPTTTLLLGASLDGMSTPKTGDKPAGDPFLDYGFSTGFTHRLVDGLALRASAGRKARFPSMRELYGEALRRFLVNPDLKPEESWIAEIGGEWTGRSGSLSSAIFGYLTENTIDQRTVDTLGAKRRQRINLEGSRTVGIELAGSARPVSALAIDGHLTYLFTRGVATTASGADSTFFISEKPEIVAMVSAEYAFSFGFMPMVEVVHTGTAQTLDDQNAFVELEPSTVINARLAYQFSMPWTPNFTAQLFLRVNNLTDAVVLPQLGLPGPGRELRAGLKLTI